MNSVTLTGVPVRLDIRSGIFEIQNQSDQVLLLTDSQENATAGIGFKVVPGGGYNTPDALEDAGWRSVWVVGTGVCVYRRVGD